MGAEKLRSTVNGSLLTRLMTFTLVGFTLLNTASIVRVVQAYAQMYMDIGQQQSFLSGLFAGIPTWAYWFGAFIFSAILVLKDNIVKDPLTRFFANTVAYLWVGLILAVITYAITGPVTNLMNTIR